MSKSEHLKFLDQCLSLAKKSIKNGNHPFGAIIVHNDQAIISSENEVISTNDLTAHAELLLLKKAQKRLSSNDLKKSILYTSTEPCAMCSGAIYWAGISHVVFGCSTKQLNEVVGGSLALTCEEVFSTGTRHFSIETFSEELKFKEIHQSFWPIMK